MSHAKPWSSPQCTTIAHRHSLAIFHRRQGIARKFCSGDGLLHFFNAEKIAVRWRFLIPVKSLILGPLEIAHFCGAAKLATTTTEIREFGAFRSSPLHFWPFQGSGAVCFSSKPCWRPLFLESPPKRLKPWARTEEIKGGQQDLSLALMEDSKIACFIHV